MDFKVLLYSDFEIVLAGIDGAALTLKSCVKGSIMDLIACAVDMAGRVSPRPTWDAAIGPPVGVVVGA